MFDLPIPWSTFWLILGLILVVLTVATLTRQKENDYDWRDLLREGEPPRASLTKHIILASFLLSVWLVVMRTLDADNKIAPSVDTLLLGILGIFVLGRSADIATHRFSRRQPSTTIVAEAEHVTVEPPPKR